MCCRAGICIVVKTSREIPAAHSGIPGFKSQFHLHVQFPGNVHPGTCHRWETQKDLAGFLVSHSSSPCCCEHSGRRLKDGRHLCLFLSSLSFLLFSSPPLSLFLPLNKTKRNQSEINSFQYWQNTWNGKKKCSSKKFNLILLSNFSFIWKVRRDRQVSSANLLPKFLQQSWLGQDKAKCCALHLGLPHRYSCSIT